MSAYSYISFPRVVDTSFLKSQFDSSKLVTNDDNNTICYVDFENDLYGIGLINIDNATFNNVFENRFIYLFNVQPFKFQFISPDEKDLADTIVFFEGDAERAKRQITHTRKQAAFFRKNLYDIIKFNTNIGECVEIYTGWIVEESYNFGPENEKRMMGLERVLISGSLYLRRDLKYEIYRLE